MNTVTIIIPSYNSSKNITELIKSLLIQNYKDLKINILIYSDCSSDTTYEDAKILENNLVKVVKGKKRLGFGGVVKKFLTKYKSDVVIILNDDIKITDKQLIIKLIQPILNSNRVGLVGGNTQPISENKFVPRAVDSSFRAYERMYESYRDGNNIFSCDGKIMALSKDFIKSIQFPAETKYMGNVDTFLYLSCLRNCFAYQYIKSAVVYYKNPDSVDDYIKWTTRNNSTSKMFFKHFGNLAKTESKLPLILYYYEFIEFMKNPLGGLFLIFTKIYVRIKARRARYWFTPIWEVVSSTKVKLS